MDLRSGPQEICLTTPCELLANLSSFTCTLNPEVSLRQCQYQCQCQYLTRGRSPDFGRRPRQLGLVSQSIGNSSDRRPACFVAGTRHCWYSCAGPAHGSAVAYTQETSPRTSAALGLALSPLPDEHGLLPRTPSHHLAILKLSKRSMAPALQATFVSRGAHRLGLAPVAHSSAVMPSPHSCCAALTIV